jgi:hypothetical protein
MAMNDELKCRDVYHTTDSQSVEIDASCGVLAGFDCPPQPKLPCDMDCNPLVTPVAEYRLDKLGFPQPAISIKWASTTADRVTVGTAVRHSQIDRTHIDYPIKEFNATVEILEPNVFQLELDPYTKDPGASYGVQVCIFYEKACNDAQVNWANIGQSPIFFNTFIDQLPPPPPRQEVSEEPEATEQPSMAPKEHNETKTTAGQEVGGPSPEHRPKGKLEPPKSEPEPTVPHEIHVKKPTRPVDDAQSQPQRVTDGVTAMAA